MIFSRQIYRLKQGIIVCLENLAWQDMKKSKNGYFHPENVYRNPKTTSDLENNEGRLLLQAGNKQLSRKIPEKIPSP